MNLLLDYQTDDWPALPPLHTLINQVHHADALELLALLPDASVDCTITDPPYRMTERGRSCRPNWMPHSMGDNVFEGELPDANLWMREVYRVLKDGTHFYTFCSVNDITDFLTIAARVGFSLVNILTMIKDTSMPSRWYMKSCEQVLFFRKGAGRPINNYASRDYFNVVMPKQSNGKQHITEKPLSFIRHMVTNSTEPGQLVLDPFMGSGTTADAAKIESRNYIGCDISADYVQIARKRLAQPFTVPMFDAFPAAASE